MLDAIQKHVNSGLILDMLIRTNKVVAHLEALADTNSCNISSEGFWDQHLFPPIHKLHDRQHSPRPSAADPLHVTALYCWLIVRLHC